MMHSDEQIKYWTDKYTELEKHAKALQVYLDAECSIRRVAEMKLETCRTALGEVFFSELDRLLCEHDRAILEAAAERVKKLKTIINIESETQRSIFHQGIDYAIQAVLEPITKEKS